MSNRAQRRAYDKSVPSVMRGKTRDQKIAMLCKNGITPVMLEQEFKAGFKAGRDNGIQGTIKTVYAAVMLAARKEYGFGKDRATRLLRAVDDIVVTSLTSDETIDEVWDKMGVKLNFDEGVDRIQEGTA